MNDHISTVETLSALKRQEESAYYTTAGLYEDHLVDARCRLFMVEWCHTVADFCKFSPDTIAIAVNNMDRYLAKRPHVLDDKRQFQLVVMTCLYTAVKLNELEVLDTYTVSRLSKGVYSEEEIEEAEIEIIATLRWRLNPPTAMAFAVNYLKLLPTHPSKRAWEIVKAQVDLAVADASFLGTNNSCIGLAAVSNALSLLQEPLKSHSSIHAICIEMELEGVPSDIQEKLIVRAQAAYGIQIRPALVRREASKTMASSTADLSPRCVTMSR